MKNMTPAEFALIKNIEITTRKLISGPLLGDARTSYKGGGFEFHQLRDYVQGDDIRFIDWKSSARSNKMLVRQYLEDRNRNVYIALDISASTNYGSTNVLKADLMKQLAATLAFVSLHKKDAVGLILFSKEVEKVIPPGSSRSHIFALIQTLYSHVPLSRETDLAAPLNYLARLKGQKALVCFISDFMGVFDQSMLSIVARRHDLMLFRCLDKREVDFPEVGTLLIRDSESNQTMEIEGSASAINDALTLWHRHQKETFMAAKVDNLDLLAGASFAGELLRFLRTRIYG